MNTHRASIVRLAALAGSVCITLFVLSMVVSISEPRRSELMVATAARTAAAPDQMARTMAAPNSPATRVVASK